MYFICVSMCHMCEVVLAGGGGRKGHEIPCNSVALNAVGAGSKTPGPLEKH